MDNYDQLSKILKYQEHLSTVVGKEIDNNVAAQIWIRKYAEVWRLKHPVSVVRAAA